MVKRFFDRFFVAVGVLCLCVGATGCFGSKEPKEETTPAQSAPGEGSDGEQPAADSTDKKEIFVSVGTGSTTGVYYPVGQAIAKILNTKYDEHKMRLSAQSTAGSVFNVNALIRGNIELGLVQSDRQWQVKNAEAEWQGKSDAAKDLRAVFSIYSETVSLVVPAADGIKALEGLKGKTVNIGPQGSGIRGNALDILKAAGLDWQKDIVAESLSPNEAPRMFQDNRVDAFFFTGGQPSGVLTEASSGKRKISFLPLNKKLTQALVKQYPYYSEDVISYKHYPQAVKNVEGDNVTTLAVRATLMTSAKVPEDVIYSVTKEIIENLEQFQKLHPALEAFNKDKLFNGLSLPLHKGALRFYKEIGLASKLPEHLKT